MRTNYWSKLFMAAFAVCAMLPVVASAQCTPQAGMGSVALSAAGGYMSIPIYAPAGCPWTLSEGVSWMAIVSARSGYGNGVVTVYVAGNSTHRARSGNLSVIRPVYSTPTLGGRSAVAPSVVTSRVGVVQYP